MEYALLCTLERSRRGAGTPCAHVVVDYCTSISISHRLASDIVLVDALLQRQGSQAQAHGENSVITLPSTGERSRAGSIVPYSLQYRSVLDSTIARLEQYGPPDRADHRATPSPLPTGTSRLQRNPSASSCTALSTVRKKSFILHYRTHTSTLACELV